MRFTLLVLSPPDLGAASRHALAFARAALDGGHDIACAFFQDAGVLTALDGCEAPQDECDLRAGWQVLCREHDLALFACVASAARFGLLPDGDDGARVMAGFRIGGLGELVEASQRSDRLLTFAD
jgi:tRNA 2-thiouridine synthesizing protein D